VAPDGRPLASGVLTAPMIIIWDLATGRPRRRLEVARGPIVALAYSPDGTRLATASGRERTVLLWNSESGQLEHLIEAHSASVSSVAFSPDGRTLATVGDDAEARLWTVATGLPQRQLATDAGGLDDVAFSPDGMTLGARGNITGDLRLWHLDEPISASSRSDRITWPNNLAARPQSRASPEQPVPRGGPRKG
jgi:WD40 repeat protein